jgi:hypothetical protein
MTNKLWFEYPNRFQWGDTNVDSGLGGPHDITLLCPANYPVTSIVPGVIASITAPLWGKCVGILLDTPVNGIGWFHYLHLSAVNPVLKVGQHVTDDLIGWVGGGTTDAMYQGTTNPTGHNFLDDTFNSDSIQVGVALMQGPAYGGPGWQNFPPINNNLNPQGIIDAARKNAYEKQQFRDVWTASGKRSDTGIYQKLLGYSDTLSMCYPVSEEIATVDVSGNACIMQRFDSGYYVVYISGKTNVYDAHNRLVIVL